MNQDLVLSHALPVTLFCIMFSMGTGLLINDFRRVSPFAMLIGIVSQMLLLPALALIVILPLQLSPEIVVGFMILAFSPGGTTSNMFSYLANGNLALSITLTAVVSIITPITIPLLGGVVLAWQMGTEQDIYLPFLPTFAKLVVVTLIPVALGMLLRYFRGEFCQRNEKLITHIPLFMLLFVIAGIIHKNWEQMPLFVEQTGFPALLLASLALVGGYLFARSLKQSKQDSRTIAIETGIQNAGTAILVTGTI
ncbi:MAG: bile acid:sodium symporter family protein, partial [Pseudomonadota bacterium]